MNIADQVALEREQIKTGITLLEENTEKLENKRYASATVYGNSLIKQVLPEIAKSIEDSRNRLHKGQAGRSFKEVKQYLAEISAEEAAAIGLKLAFDTVFSKHDNARKAVSVCRKIGRAIELECQVRYYEKTEPELYRYISEKYWHQACGTQQKVTTMQTLYNRRDTTPWKFWGSDVTVKLGGWLLDCVNDKTGWFSKAYKIIGKTKKILYIEASEKLLSEKEMILSQASLFAPLRWPMLIEPKDWSNKEKGGYILSEVIERDNLVRGHNGLLSNGACEQGETPLAFLNKLQKVGYRVNGFILDVAEQLYERGHKVGKFIPPYSEDLPPKPFDIDVNPEGRLNWKRKAAEVHNRNQLTFRRSCRTRSTLEAARRFRQYETFYLPWSFDYRGRAYPIPVFLTPQDTDFGKSLLRFSDEAFVTPESEDWLAFQVATCLGLDKAPIIERLEWAKNNHDHIHAVATDPLGTIALWEGADEPWQFLAACEEYNAVIIDCTRHFTGLMVATDATCSGLQILAGLARDKTTAKMVNVLPSDRPQDAYKVIAEEAKPNCPAAIQPHMDRKVTKRTVMTVPYNAKPFSNRSYIRDALREKGVEITKEDLTETVSAVRAAMHKLVPGPMKVMDWIEKEVAKAIKRGANHLTWTTPSGFVVYQKLNKSNTQRVKLNLFGECQIKVGTSMSNEVDLAHHKNATSPNLIHSLDASLLHLSTQQFDAPITLIHDSVLCRATDMSELSAVVRKTYMHLFAEHDYLLDFAAAIGAEEKPPIIGDLKPESVIESTYFFC